MKKVLQKDDVKTINIFSGTLNFILCIFCKYKNDEGEYYQKSLPIILKLKKNNFPKPTQEGNAKLEWFCNY